MTEKVKTKQKLKPYNAKVQVCPDCGKVDVSKGHEKVCGGKEDAEDRFSHNEWFWKD